MRLYERKRSTNKKSTIYSQRIIIKNRSPVYKLKVGVERPASNYCKVALCLRSPTSSFIFHREPGQRLNRVCHNNHYTIHTFNELFIPLLSAYLLPDSCLFCCHLLHNVELTRLTSTLYKHLVCALLLISSRC